jgi:hypothetical protein
MAVMVTGRGLDPVLALPSDFIWLPPNAMAELASAACKKRDRL